MPEVPAQLREVFDRRNYSEWEILELVLGDWLQEHVLGPLNTRLCDRNRAAKKKRRKQYAPVDLRALLAYFLKRFVRSLWKVQKHNIRSWTLDQLDHELMGRNHVLKLFMPASPSVRIKWRIYSPRCTPICCESSSQEPMCAWTRLFFHIMARTHSKLAYSRKSRGNHTTMGWLHTFSRNLFYLLVYLSA